MLEVLEVSRGQRQSVDERRRGDEGHLAGLAERDGPVDDGAGKVDLRRRGEEDLAVARQGAGGFAGPFEAIAPEQGGICAGHRPFLPVGGQFNTVNADFLRSFSWCDFRAGVSSANRSTSSRRAWTISASLTWRI